MKKRIAALLVSACMIMGTLAGCSAVGTVDDNTSNDSTASAPAEIKTNSEDGVQVVLSLGNASDYYIGTMVGATIQQAFEEAGAEVQVVDGADDVANQVNQLQTAASSNADIIYIFPAGDGPTYYDAIKMCKDAGKIVLMSNNYAGENICDAFVGNDEFQMGVMMAAMIGEWADSNYPEAGAGDVDVLILESTFNNNCIRRCLGMRLVSEKFLRTADTANTMYVKTEGDAVTYIDADGKEVEVDEPTGGLLLDADGHAQLNPYYNDKINLVEYSNRLSTGTDATEAQNAIENAITEGYTDLKAIISYGDVGAACETKVRELIEDGKISTDVNKFGVFCSDLTDTNKELILKSKDDTSILRGVMASGDLIQELCGYAKASVDAVNNGTAPAIDVYKMEPLSYMKLNEAGDDIEVVYYTDSAQLPETDLFFQ